VALWQTAPLPAGFTELWRHELASVAELSLLRARVRAEVTGTAVVAQPDHDDWSEQLVLIVDELTSNALRHGGAPVDAALSRAGDQWLVTVTDSSAQTPPVPAQGRDPGLGGFGLYLVADLAVRHGWCQADGSKTVWAVVADPSSPS
jgi:anti-sigma regulatory factor (Ser/Thr protein kinase)